MKKKKESSLGKTPGGICSENISKRRKRVTQLLKGGVPISLVRSMTGHGLNSEKLISVYTHNIPNCISETSMRIKDDN